MHLGILTLCDIHPTKDKFLNYLFSFGFCHVDFYIVKLANLFPYCFWILSPEVPSTL